MKVLSLNFLTCAVKACKSSSNSYPLHPKDAELVQDDIEVNAQLLINLLPRIDWTALSTTATEVRVSYKTTTTHNDNMFNKENDLLVAFHRLSITY